MYIKCIYFIYCQIGFEWIDYKMRKAKLFFFAFKKESAKQVKACDAKLKGPESQPAAIVHISTERLILFVSD